MSNEVTFLNQDWFWPVVIGWLLLLTVFIWKEWTTISKKRKFLKMVLALVAISSLALIALKPALLTTMDKGRAVLLTEGYEEERLDSLIAANKSIKIIKYGKGEPMQRNLDSVSALFILGNGPAPFDFWQFEGIPSTYLAGELPDGITRIKFDRENTLGSALQILGRYENPQKGNYVVLEAPGGLGLDSLAIGDEVSQNFNLSTALKVKGNFVYRLTEKDSMGKVIYSEPLPISVMERRPLKVLMINSFPTFESKYLKNYLAEMNHEVMVRSQLTKGKYKFEYFNSERTPLYGFSKENLKQFDILIIDASTYKTLSSISQAALIGSAKDDGLGIFIQPDAGFFPLPKSKTHFDFKRTKGDEVSFEDFPKVKIENFPYRFDAAFAVQPIQTSNGRVLSAYKRLGMGRVGTTVLQNTYQLVLDGHLTVYQQLWTEIIAAVSNRNLSKVAWEAGDGFAVHNQPYDFTVRTSYDTPRVINGHGSFIPLRQNADLAYLWHGTTYPRDKGWNQLIIEGDSVSTYRFYVCDSTEWTSVIASKTIAANKKYFNEAITQVKKTSVFRPIDPIWFFLVFLICSGWLWLEPKLYGN